MRRPVAGNIPAQKTKPVARKPEERHWRFSFQFFRQREYFGLGNQNANWFISLLEVLTELSKKTPEQILSNPAEKLQWRLHPIDFDARNAPIQREQIDWTPKEILENKEEFPFMQFQISKAIGRVIGFWDENGVFNVLLLDPMHNMQPSNYNDYRLRETEVGNGEYAATLCLIEGKMAACASEACVCRNMYSEVQATLNSGTSTTTVLVPLSQEIYDQAVGYVQDGVANSIAEIIELGIADLSK